MKSHRHICGDIGDKQKFIFDLSKGCGHVFRHTKSKLHLCPKCKREVTTVIATSEDIKELQTLLK